MKPYFNLLFILFVLCVSCKEEAEMPPSIFYELITDHPIVDSTGVTFTASYKAIGVADVTNRGFIVTHNFGLDSYTTKAYPISLDGEFSLRIETDWIPGMKSTVYAYMETAKYNYQGEIVDFIPEGVSLPVIHSVSPGHGGISGCMIIRGENFSQHKSRVSVSLGETSCWIEKVTPTELTVYYDLDQTGFHDLKVRIGELEVVLKDAYYLDGVEILSVSPNEIYSVEIFTIEVRNFRQDMPVSVFIGRNYVTILEKTDNQIKCLCPNIPDGIDTQLYIYMQDEYIRTPDINITVPLNWNLIFSDNPSFGGKRIVVDNDNYTIFNNEIRLFKSDSNVPEWTTVTTLPSEIDGTVFFGKGDCIYVGGEELYKRKTYSLYKYHISGRYWEKCEKEIPFQLSPNYLGEWIDNEYYIMTPLYDAYSTFGYSPENDTWTLRKRTVENYNLFSVGDQVYALLGGELHEYDMKQQKRVKLVYEFTPREVRRYDAYKIERRGNIIYFGVGNTLFYFDLVSKELNSLPSPRHDIWGFDFIFPIGDALYVGCKSTSGYEVYEYVGAKKDKLR